MDEAEYIAQFDVKHLTPVMQEKFHDIFLDMQQAMAEDKTDIGRTHLMEMEIQTPPKMYAKQKERRIDPEKLKFLYPIIQHYLDKGIIRLTNSNFASNLVLVRKPVKSSPDDIKEEKINQKQQYSVTTR